MNFKREELTYHKTGQFLKGKSKCTYINQHVLLQIRIFDTEKKS